MDNSEIAKQNDKELLEKLKEERALLVKLRLQHGVTPIENPKRIPAQKKLIARLLTQISQRSKTASAK